MSKIIVGEPKGRTERQQSPRDGHRAALVPLRLHEGEEELRFFRALPGVVDVVEQSWRPKLLGGREEHRVALVRQSLPSVAAAWFLRRPPGRPKNIAFARAIPDSQGPAMPVLAPAAQPGDLALDRLGQLDQPVPPRRPQERGELLKPIARRRRLARVTTVYSHRRPCSLSGNA